jgi:spermidine synthase
MNTLGAAAGAYLAGFVLPPAIGYLRSYLVSLGLTAAVAIIALVLARPPAQGSSKQPARITPDPQPAAGPAALSQPMIAGFCFVSGLGTLALEVLWTHMFSHVYLNTVYTFSAILVTTLLCLALGAGISGRLSRRNWSGGKVLLILMTATGAWVCLTPYLFITLTDNMQVVSSHSGWAGYTGKVFGLTLAVLGIPLCLLGTLFPYLLKLSERYVTSAGRMLGRLAAINTAGAILGSLLAGFVLLSWWGLWPSIHGIAVLYALLAVILAFTIKSLGRAWRATGLAGLLLCAGLLRWTNPPPMRLAPGEFLVEYWHGANGTVAVVQQGDNRAIKIDGHYGLGGTAADYMEKGQTRIPMMLRPQAKSIYFLGLGTGITAGEACSGDSGLDRIVACELVPEVVTAARKYFGDYTEALFTDPRCQVVVDDGRHYLAATRETFDIINSDLFVVYHKGAGSLYSLEHFQTVKQHLNPNGIFVLWIPIYQLSEQEFGIITRTMAEVFPQVTAWRNQFPIWQDSIALVGQTDERPLFAEGHEGFQLDQRREIWERQGHGIHPTNLLLYYCGNLSRAGSLFARYPLNTDDRPQIEYLTPVSASLQAADKATWLAGPKFVALLEKIQDSAPPEEDPALAGLPPEQRHAARAGYHLGRALLCEDYYKKTHEREPVWMQEAIKSQQEVLRIWLQAESR